MLGAIGFLVAAFSVILFTTTFNRAFPLPNKRTNEAFAYALYSLAAALVLWGAATFFNDKIFTKEAIYAGELLLAAGSVAMLNVIAPLDALDNMLATLVAGLALVYRQTSVPMTAYVQNGLLHFNLQGGFRSVVLIAFLVIWFPAMFMLARRVCQVFPQLAAIQSSILLYFTSLTFLTALFLSARRDGMIIAQFIGVIVLFLLGAFFNERMGKIVSEKAPANHRKGSHAAVAAK